MDFIHDQLATGRKLRMLTIIDTFSRFSPAIEPRFNFRGPDVVEILEEVGRQVGLPKVIRVDQGKSLSDAISTSGPISAASRSTSPDRASPLTTPSSSHSMANFERNV
jgi:putative transposase